MAIQDEEIITRLSKRPQQICEGTISDPTLSEWKFPAFSPDQPSSLGKLDKLPLEMLHECVAHMDLLSLLRFSRVSCRGLAVIRSHILLRTFTSTAKDIPAVLAKTRILGLHSLATLYTALCSEKCISCGSYGSFLHLLLAQRCCFPCLIVNQSLWTISLPKAKKCFGIQDHRLKRLPVMWSIPGIYGVPKRKSRQQARRLTSVRAAKELAIKHHGSFEDFEQAHPVDQDFEEDVMNWYRRAPLHPLSQDPLAIDERESRPVDVCEGMGVVYFPCLANGRIELGHGCRGCEDAYEQYVCKEMDEDVVDRMVPQGCNANVYLSRVKHRVWSTTGLIQHARQCHLV